MIIPLMGGYLLGKHIVNRYASGATALLFGLAAGIISGLGIAPVLYPLFAGVGSGPAIPEYREMIIHFLVREIPVFSEVFYIFGGYPIWVLSIMTALGVVGGAIGYALGRKQTIQVTDWRE